MPSWCPIVEYREFYDVPRMVLFDWNGDRYLIDCPFDDVKDDYADNYVVYLLSRNVVVSADWTGMSLKGKIVGQMPVAPKLFDDTRRKFIDASFLEGMT